MTEKLCDECGIEKELHYPKTEAHNVEKPCNKFKPKSRLRCSSCKMLDGKHREDCKMFKNHRPQVNLKNKTKRSRNIPISKLPR